MNRKPKRAITLEKIMGGRTYNAYLRELEKKKQKKESHVRMIQLDILENEFDEKKDEFKRDYSCFVLKLPLIKSVNLDIIEKSMPKILKLKSYKKKKSLSERIDNSPLNKQNNIFVIDKLSETNFRKDIMDSGKGSCKFIRNYNFPNIDNRIEEIMNSSNTNSNDYLNNKETNQNMFLTKSEHAEVNFDKTINSTNINCGNKNHKSKASLNHIAEKIGKLGVYSNISIQNFLDVNYFKNYETENIIRNLNQSLCSDSWHYQAQKVSNIDSFNNPKIIENYNLNENKINFLNSKNNNFLRINDIQENKKNINLKSLVFNLNKTFEANVSKNFLASNLKLIKMKNKNNHYMDRKERNNNECKGKKN